MESWQVIAWAKIVVTLIVLDCSVGVPRRFRNWVWSCLGASFVVAGLASAVHSIKDTIFISIGVNVLYDSMFGTRANDNEVRA